MPYAWYQLPSNLSKVGFDGARTHILSEESDFEVRRSATGPRGQKVIRTENCISLYVYENLINNGKYIVTVTTLRLESYSCPLA